MSVNRRVEAGEAIGAAGFVGSNLCDQLLARNHQVWGIDNLSIGDASHLAHLRDHPRFSLLITTSQNPCPMP